MKIKEKKYVKIVKTEYTIWMVIEQRTVYDDGEEIYKDVEGFTASAGTFRELANAVIHMEHIHASDQEPSE